MKKRLFACILALAMALALLPSTALAEYATSVYVNGVELNAETPYWKNGDDAATSDPDPTGYNAFFDTSTTLPTLWLNNCEATTGSHAVVTNSPAAICAVGDIILHLTGSSTAVGPSKTDSSTTGGTAFESYGVLIKNGNLTIRGSGRLTATGGSVTSIVPASSYGIRASDAFTMESGTVFAEGGTVSSTNGNAYSLGVNSKTFTMTGGALSATGGSAATTSGAWVQSVGLIVSTAASSATINGGVFTATGNEVSGGTEGNYSLGLNSSATLTINGGTVTLSGAINAINTAPDLAGYTAALIITASANADGSSQVDYVEADIANYKYLRVEQPTVATPTFGLAAGTYTTAQSVTISCATPDAVICYTTDGTDPTGASTVYSAPITVSANTLIKARAFCESMSDSAIAEAAYTIRTAQTPEVTVYNDPNASKATIWLTGRGLYADDLLVTERLTSGSDYDAMLKLADEDDVFRVYNISLRSGKTSTGNAMYLHFDLAVKYAGQKFTLLHKNIDGSYEYLYATADANGDPTFGPVVSLSPFMLVKGTLSSDFIAPPQTGDSVALAGVGILLLLAVFAACGAAKRKHT